MCLKIKDRKYEEDKEYCTIKHHNVYSTLQWKAVEQIVKENALRRTESL